MAADTALYISPDFRCFELEFREEAPLTAHPTSGPNPNPNSCVFGGL